MKKPHKLTPSQRVRLRAAGRIFLARAKAEPDKQLALENRRVGLAALTRAKVEQS